MGAERPLQVKDKMETAMPTRKDHPSLETEKEKGWRVLVSTSGCVTGNGNDTGINKILPNNWFSDTVFIQFSSFDTDTGL